MKTDSTLLLQQLTAIAQQDLQTALFFRETKLPGLTKKPTPNSWNALQCLEHLNLYAAFYLPEIEKNLIVATVSQPVFKSGLVGNMLVNMVVPKEQGKKMKTFAAMNPQENDGGLASLEVFIANQQKLLAFLAQAQKTNLNSRGVAVTFTGFIKLRLGDALRFMVYHHQRHVQQAVRAID